MDATGRNILYQVALKEAGETIRVVGVPDGVKVTEMITGMADYLYHHGLKVLGETPSHPAQAAPKPQSAPAPTPPPQDGGFAPPTDEEIRDGMASTGFGSHNPRYWDGTDTRCPGCGKATLVKNLSDRGPTYECSTRESIKTDQVNPKTGKAVYASIGPCDYQDWPPKDWD